MTGRDPAFAASPSSQSSLSRPDGLQSGVGFTPGPWVVHDTIDGPLSNTDIRDSRNLFVARCASMLGRPHVAETEANARLIAAAPELYEALTELAAAICAERSGDEELEGWMDSVEWVDAAREEASAALAKARGEA